MNDKNDKTRTMLEFATERAQALALALGILALVLEHLRSRSAVTREDLHALAERVGELAFDPDADVRAIAMRVLETYSSEAGFETTVGLIRRELDSPNRPTGREAVMATRCESGRCAMPTCVRASCRARADESSVARIEVALQGEPAPPAWAWVLAAVAMAAGGAWFAW